VGVGSDGVEASAIFVLLVFGLVMVDWLSVRDDHGPVGLMSIDFRIRLSKLSLLLFTCSTGGKMCKAGPAAILKSERVD
jgi:hypothetical protein